MGAKHSFDDLQLLEAIDRKYVRSETGQKKGVGQLQSSLKRFLLGETLIEADVTRDKVHTIHPLIISADPALTSPLVAIYLDKKLDRSLIRLFCKRTALAPLQIATFADLERLLPYTNTVPFEAMLEAANESNLKGGNFRQRAREAIKSAAPGRDFVKDRWESLADELCGYLPSK